MNPVETVTKLIDEGLAAHRVGDAATAKNCYEAALRENPNQPEALHLLGLINEQGNNRLKALQLITRAIAVNPKEPLFHLNIAAILEKEERFLEAANHLEQALAITPRSKDILMRLGVMMGRAGEFVKAAEAYRKAIEIDPSNHDAFIAYAVIMAQLGQHQESLRAALYVLSQNNRNSSAYALASTAMMTLRKWRALVNLAEQWKSVLGENDGANRALATAYHEIEDIENARKSYKALLDNNPNSLEILSTFARFCVSTLDYETADNLLEKALNIEPNDVDSLFATAKLNMARGDMDLAKDCCEKIFKTQQNYVPAYQLFVRLNDANVSDEILERVISLSADKSQIHEHRASLHFAAGDIYHQRKLYDKAMQDFQRGNNVTVDMQKQEGIFYRPEQNEKLRRIEMQCFDFERIDAEYDKGPVTPIFIVGMPRSGSTLTESIIAAHQDVFGGGEMHALRRVHANVVKWLGDESDKKLSSASFDELRSWRQEYFDALPDCSGAQFIVDKQLTNFRSAGLMRALFPEAPIIYIRRNPVDTGFSIFRHHFEKVWLYATDFENIAHAYGVCAHTMSYWEERLKENLMLIQYEELISDFESQAKRLIEGCGLDWRDECLDFHTKERTVATFSSMQVRKPLQRKRTSAVDQYGSALSPLIRTLKKANVDLETGAYLKD